MGIESTPNEWATILDGLTPEQAADRIFGDIGGYPNRGTRNYDCHHGQDIAQLANALRAVCRERVLTEL